MEVGKGMRTEGWRRLWIFTKVIGAIAAAGYALDGITQTIAAHPDTSPLTGGQILIGGIIAGGVAYGFLTAVEWVAKGFFKPTPPESPVTQDIVSENPRVAASDMPSMLSLTTPEDSKRRDLH